MEEKMENGRKWKKMEEKCGEWKKNVENGGKSGSPDHGKQKYASVFS